MYKENPALDAGFDGFCFGVVRWMLDDSSFETLFCRITMKLAFLEVDFRVDHPYGCELDDRDEKLPKIYKSSSLSAEERVKCWN